jgi:hypothetical protein
MGKKKTLQTRLTKPVTNGRDQCKLPSRPVEPEPELNMKNARENQHNFIIVTFLFFFVD